MIRIQKWFPVKQRLVDILKLSQDKCSEHGDTLCCDTEMIQ